jgi:hypothetical protein
MHQILKVVLLIITQTICYSSILENAAWYLLRTVYHDKATCFHWNEIRIRQLSAHELQGAQLKAESAHRMYRPAYSCIAA